MAKGERSCWMQGRSVAWWAPEQFWLLNNGADTNTILGTVFPSTASCAFSICSRSIYSGHLDRRPPNEKGKTTEKKSAFFNHLQIPTARGSEYKTLISWPAMPPARGGQDKKNKTVKTTIKAPSCFLSVPVCSLFKREVGRRKKPGI